MIRSFLAVVAMITLMLMYTSSQAESIREACERQQTVTTEYCYLKATM